MLPDTITVNGRVFKYTVNIDNNWITYAYMDKDGNTVIEVAGDVKHRDDLSKTFNEIFNILLGGLNESYGNRP